MNNNYHAVIINISQKTDKIFNSFKILEIRKRFLGLLKLYKIEIPENDIEEAINIVQTNINRNLNKEWYATFYNEEKAIIVFKQRVFRVSTIGIQPVYQKLLDISTAEEKETWNELIVYAKSLGIPDSQLDFLPPNFTNEEY